MTKEFSDKFLEFLNNTGSPYHSVDETIKILKSNGFKKLDDNEEIKRGGKYYMTLNYSTILAFKVGEEFDLEDERSMVIITGSHTDSPCLRVRPSSITCNEGYTQLSVSTYGGGLWHTWFDRGLGIAGKVVDNACNEYLVKIKRPICAIPNLAIHLTTSEERSSFVYDKEKHLQPIISKTDTNDKYGEQLLSLPRSLLDEICREINVQAQNISSFDLCLMDSVDSRYVGINDEFIDSPRLDNLGGVFSCFTALIDASESNSSDLLISVAFDHEEVGSVSFSGAHSDFLKQSLKLILAGLENSSLNNSTPKGVVNVNRNSDLEFCKIMKRSIFLSVDMAHSIHPNYPERHQSKHKPSPNNGIVIKTNFNQAYTTDCTTRTFLKTIANNFNIKTQDFLVKNSSPCGSTIGPIVASNLGIRTADIGACMLAMHSCREFMYYSDIYDLQNFIKVFYMTWSKVKLDSKLLE
ncbi:Aminopeptidase I zinc metalloprotease (M18) family protein [Cryptosporidium meleagridis]|uniref:aspartyl aminopeptidase n=1 Tax=Cryptosporidium meleagridis TaxID=93969 RepID=A0A2P4Z2F3_9CRYT|nr:Aminopeptidase I zinc metalloprotease (M18) family protein [Cryptosporidium meleagridis]